MPRFKEERTWRLLDNIPPQFFSLVREALSLRQKVVATRQSLKYLQRCRSNDVILRFIMNARVGAIFHYRKDNPALSRIHRYLLSAVIKEKQYVLYSTLLKCKAKEEACRRLLPDQMWKRIESGSKLICNALRSSMKALLYAKYDRLLGMRHGNTTDVGEVPSENHRQTNTNNHKVDNAMRVTLVGSTQLSLNAINLLSLGPSFSPAQNVNKTVYRKVVGSMQRLRDLLRLKNSRSNIAESANQRLLPSIPFPYALYKEPDPNPDVDVKMRILSCSVLAALNHHRRSDTNLTRDQWEGLKELRELRSNGTIRISVSDKGGEFVVMPRSLDRDITELHLRDNSVYRPATTKDFFSQCRRLNHVWMAEGKSAGLDERFLGRLKMDNPSCPVFYSLLKTHKLTSKELISMSADSYKIRSIISCVGGPTDRISWFLNCIVSQLLAKVPSHLNNTNQFLERMRSARFSSNCAMESFDVTSLYTNVQNDQALQALSEMLDKHGSDINSYGLGKKRIMTLVRECLLCNVFMWSGMYFSHIRGLAMGQRLAPVLAICFMSRIEEPVMARMPLMYCRHVNDCFIVTSTQLEMDECFRLMNDQSQYIKLTRETPQNGWLPYLNTQVKLSSGILSVKWYRKESSKNILLHATSAHPSFVKRNIIKNMFKTAEGVCIGAAEKDESFRLASRIAASNGYTVPLPHENGHTDRISASRETKIPLCIPFISDKMTAPIQKCIVRARLQDDVILVNIPNDNIKKQLVRNRLYDRQCISENCIVCPYGKSGDSATVGAIYQIQCQSCGATYIGETGRVHAIRVKEHVAGKRRSCASTPLGRHRLHDHGCADYDVKCTALTWETDTASRKVLEALWIPIRKPVLNNRFSVCQ